MSLNPWLGVPLADYEGHMTAPEVGQLEVLAKLFGDALDHCHPDSLIVLGVAGGNGLDRVDPAVTRRMAGVDIQPDYLDTVRQRFPSAELHCLDLARESAGSIESAALVHAAFVLEHAGTDLCLQTAMELTGTSGTLSVVLQLPGTESTAAVTRTSYATVQTLSAHFRLIDPAWLTARLAERAFGLEREIRFELPGGKACWHGMFRRRAPDDR